MSLSVNGQVVARGQAPGLVPVQPADELSVGQDTQSAVGDYTAPHPLQGTVEKVRVQTE
jgi:arylsulfatase